MKFNNADIVVLLVALVAAAAFFWYQFRGFSFKGILSLFENKTGSVVHGTAAKQSKFDASDLSKVLKTATNVRSPNATVTVVKGNADMFEKMASVRDASQLEPSTNDHVLRAAGDFLQQAKKEGLSIQKYADKIFNFVREYFQDPNQESGVLTRDQLEILKKVFLSLDAYAAKVGASGSKQILLKDTEDFLRETVGINTIQNAIAQSRGRIHFNERAESMMLAIIAFFVAYVPNTDEFRNGCATARLRSQFMSVAIKEFFEDNVRGYEKHSEAKKNHDRAEELKKASRRRNHREKRRSR